MENKREEMTITLKTFDFGETAAEESGREEEAAVTLKIWDGRELALSSDKAEAVAKQSFKIWKILQEAKKRRIEEVPVGWRILAMAIDYCFEHGKDKKLSFDDFTDENGNYFPEKFPDNIKANEAIDEKLSKWDEAFLRDCDTETILELVTIFLTVSARETSEAPTNFFSVGDTDEGFISLMFFGYFIEEAAATWHLIWQTPLGGFRSALQSGRGRRNRERWGRRTRER